MLGRGAACGAPFLRAASEVGSLRFSWNKNLPASYPAPRIPATEVVVDVGDSRKQFYKEKQIARPKIIKQVALNRYVDKSLKLLPETAAPFLKEKAKQGFAVKGCPLCLRNLQEFTYKDILLLRQYTTPWGFTVAKEYTGVCAPTYKKLVKAINKAQEHGLLPKPHDELREKKLEGQKVRRNLRADLKLEALRQAGGLREEKWKEYGNLEQQVIR